MAEIRVALEAQLRAHEHELAAAREEAEVPHTAEKLRLYQLERSLEEARGAI